MFTENGNFHPEISEIELSEEDSGELYMQINNSQDSEEEEDSESENDEESSISYSEEENFKFEEEDDKLSNNSIDSDLLVDIKDINNYDKFKD